MAAGGQRGLVYCAMYEINDGSMTSSVVEQTVTEVENKQLIRQTPLVFFAHHLHVFVTSVFQSNTFMTWS